MKRKCNGKGQKAENVLRCHLHHLSAQQMDNSAWPQVHPEPDDYVKLGVGDLPPQVHVANASVDSFNIWSKRLQDGSILRPEMRLSNEACKDALLSDFDELISLSKHHVPLWRQPSQGCPPFPLPCHELLTPSLQRVILCDVLDDHVSILQRLPQNLEWVCVETGKNGIDGCSHFTRETLTTNIPESMDIAPISFAKETVFYSNMPFPANCEHLALKFLPPLREFARSAGLTTLHLTFQALRVLIPTRSGVLRRRIPSLGLAAWLNSSAEYGSIRTFRSDTIQEVLLSGNQHRQEDLNVTLLPRQVEPALDAYASRLRELFTDSPARLACGGWLAARMFREALSRNGLGHYRLPPKGSLSLWPILLDSLVQEEMK